MAFDFTKIINDEMKKAEQAENASNSGGSGLKTLYPFNNGRFELKLIGDEKSNSIYRELTFHEQLTQNGKIRVPCLHAMYGEKCPICEMVQKVQDVLDDKNVFSKYGYKKRGIMFAKLINIEPNDYFKDNKNPPKPGEVVIFMFPKSLIANLRETILEYSDNLEKLCAANESNVVTLKVTTGANGFSQYNLYVKNTTDVMFKDEAGNPDNAAYNDFLNNLPSLNDLKFPTAPTEEHLKTIRAIVEEMNNTYFGGQVDVNVKPMVNTNTTTINTVAKETTMNNNTQMSSVSSDPVKENVSSTNNINTNLNVNTASVPSENNNLSEDTPPACFNNNKYDEECAKCPWESKCI